MFVLVVLISSWVTSQIPASLVDVTSLALAPPVIIVEIDTGKLKGEPRRLSWSADGATLYLQTGEGNPPQERLRHYTIPAQGGAVTPVQAEPDWAAEYWTVKQDRAAPGLPSLVIEVDQRQETVKSGMAPAGALDRTGSPESTAGTISPDAGHGNQKAHIVRLTLLGQVVGSWMNERVIPGTRFGWGPAGTGTIAFVGEGGRLVLFDQGKRTHAVPDVKDALLPAWSPDGTRLAYLAKSGRKKYVLSSIAIIRGREQ